MLITKTIIFSISLYFFCFTFDNENNFKCIDTVASKGILNCDLSDKYWQLIVQVEDLNTKATMQIVQGISLSLLPQNLIDGAASGPQRVLIKTVWWYQRQKIIRRK
jgi:hypothetical protein